MLPHCNKDCCVSLLDGNDGNGRCRSEERGHHDFVKHIQGTYITVYIKAIYISDLYDLKNSIDLLHREIRFGSSMEDKSETESEVSCHCSI